LSNHFRNPSTSPAHKTHAHKQTQQQLYPGNSSRQQRYRAQTAAKQLQCISPLLLLPMQLQTAVIATCHAAAVSDSQHNSSALLLLLLVTPLTVVPPHA
jgi:hypothetical protein